MCRRASAAADARSGRPTQGDCVRSSLRCARLSLLLSHLPIAGASAQWPPEIVPGTRVQAQLPETQFQPAARRGHLLRGRVAGLAPDTLYLAVTDSVGPLAIPRNLIERLEYSRGVPSRTSSALLRGLQAGAAMALVLVLWNELDEGPDRTSTGTAALVGGGVGFATGALLGALRPQERWRRVRFGISIPAP
jgi:hypothetical protein